MPKKMITFRGKTQSIQDWSFEIGLSKPGLVTRLATMSLEDALTRPKKLSKAVLEAVDDVLLDIKIDIDRPFTTDLETQVLVAMHPSGMTRDDIAWMTGLDKETIRKIEMRALNKLLGRARHMDDREA